VVMEEANEVNATPDVDVPVGRFAKKGEGLDKKKSLEEANKFRYIIQQSEFKIIKQLNKTSARVPLLELLEFRASPSIAS